MTFLAAAAKPRLAASVLASVSTVILLSQFASDTLSTEISGEWSSNYELNRNETSLPKWVVGGPQYFAREMKIGSRGLTDKVNFRHLFQYIYQPSLARLVQEKLDTPSPKLRLMEIGLGCAPSGGMISGRPGGSAFGWRHLFNQIPDLEFELHIFEFDENCLTKWHNENPWVANKVYAGDASSEKDLDRAYAESGGEPFDVIIDDASHINWHQIKTLDIMLPRVAVGGIFVMEDIQSACHGWTANMGASLGEDVGGSTDCMITTDGKETILAHIMEYQRVLVGQRDPYFKEKKSKLYDVTRIEIHTNSALLSKEVEVGI